MDNFTRLVTLYNLWTTKSILSQDDDWLLIEAYLDTWSRLSSNGFSDREVKETIEQDVTGIPVLHNLSKTFGATLHECLLSAAKEWRTISDMYR